MSFFFVRSWVLFFVFWQNSKLNNCILNSHHISSPQQQYCGTLLYMEFFQCWYVRGITYSTAVLACKVC